MKWMNEPKIWERGIKDHPNPAFRDNAKALRMVIPKKTDCWRTTLHDTISDNVPFYYRNVCGDFEVILQATATFTGNYNQAGIMVREDEETWMTCGFQVFDNNPQASAVVTRGVSDWSLMPLPKASESVYFVVKRLGNCVESFFSFDGHDWTQIRQAVLSENPDLKVGMYGACPQGDPFEVMFLHFTIKSEDGAEIENLTHEENDDDDNDSSSSSGSDDDDSKSSAGSGSDSDSD